MADIELVIKIPEEVYEYIKRRQPYVDKYGYTYVDLVFEAVLNSTSLPKGHGRLMILSENKLKENQINLDFSCQEWISEVGLSNATVAIIEADKAEREEG